MVISFTFLIKVCYCSHCTFCVCGIKSSKKRQAALGIRQEEDHKIKNNKINNNLARRFTECLEQDQDRSVRILTVAVGNKKNIKMGSRFFFHLDLWVHRFRCTMLSKLKLNLYVIKIVVLNLHETIVLLVATFKI